MARQDELRAEYKRKELGPGVRGKYFEEYQKGTNLVLLSPDVAAVFPTDKAVNEALRSLIEVARRSKGLAPRSTGRAKKRRAGWLVETRSDGGMLMPQHRIYRMKFSSVYPMYVQKAERKNRTKQEVDQVISWLTGYSQAELQRQIDIESDFEAFFANAPMVNPNASLIKGVVCGVRVEEIEDPLMRKVRYLDKLIDELAKGKALDKILRQ